jgi:hypothetical protein
MVEKPLLLYAGLSGLWLMGIAIILIFWFALSTRVIKSLNAP